MIRLKHDSRDKQFYQKFGQRVDFPTNLDFDSAQYDDVQPIGDVRCTCFTTCDMAEDQENRVFDINDLWNRIPQSRFGADPRDALGEAVKNGLLPVGQTQRVRNWRSYWSAISGDKDYFDNVRSALMVAQSPVGAATYWYAEWINSTILPVGKTPLNGHMYSIEGWKEINGEPMLIIEAWAGRKFYMPREVFNKAMSPYGVGAWVLSTDEIDEKIKINILTKIKDACINVITLLKQLIVMQTPVEKPVPQPQSSIYNEVKESIKMTSSQKLYDVAYSLLGKYLTLNSAVPKNLNCAQALSFVLKQAGYVVPKKGISHTTQMYEWLKENCDEVSSPNVGDIIISVTVGDNHGHAGIVGKNSIMSNDSSTGLWKAYWNVKTWIDYYSVQKKLKTLYFRVR